MTTAVRGRRKFEIPKVVKYALVFAVLATVMAVQLYGAPLKELLGWGGPTAAQAGEEIGVQVVNFRPPTRDYRRNAFGKAWSDDTDAPLGRNGCDTRNDVLNRDLVNKNHVKLRRCPFAVASGDLHDPYSGEWIHFVRGKETSAQIQIDHIVPLAYAWDMGAKLWSPELRQRFANDPGNLVAVGGAANKDKGDQPPGVWMPREKAFHCAYAQQFTEVSKAYGLTIESRSAKVLASTLRECTPRSY